VSDPPCPENIAPITWEHIKLLAKKVRESEAEIQRLQGFFLAYPRDRMGWICSVCHRWNESNSFCMHSRIHEDTYPLDRDECARLGKDWNRRDLVTPSETICEAKTISTAGFANTHQSTMKTDVKP
jgi:hypothetical protein